MIMPNQDTICAIATAPGMGGIAVIRVSGLQAENITLDCLHKNTSLPDRKAIFTTFYQSDTDEILDEIVVTAFHAPHSYTGENVVEISCHASPFIEQKILQTLIHRGCRMAEPGEFTKRAYLNGKMDLSQAEAVADLIASESKAQHRMAIRQMRGNYSSELDGLREKLLHFIALIELELDFSEEAVEFADRSQLQTLAEEIRLCITRLEHSFRLGNAIKKGIPVAIVGPTNAGKSTLLNSLVGEEKAIVSNIHGTTRDVIEDTVILNGTLFRFIDTAGLRHSVDVVENLGIERSYRKLKEASIVLLVLDLTEVAEQGLPEVFHDITMQITPEQKFIIVLNKVDKSTTDKAIEGIPAEVSKARNVCYISAADGQGMDELIAMITSAAILPAETNADIIVSNVRHYNLLKQSRKILERVQTGLNENLSGELLTQDLRQIVNTLGEITGGFITETAILHHIFNHFCIGK